MVTMVGRKHEVQGYNVTASVGDPPVFLHGGIWKSQLFVMQDCPPHCTIVLTWLLPPLSSTPSGNENLKLPGLVSDIPQVPSGCLIMVRGGYCVS